MSTVINRKTLQIITLADTPHYDPMDYVIIMNPSLLLLPQCDPKYYKLVPNDVPPYIVEMDSNEKVIKDNEIALERRYNRKSKNDIMTELWFNMTPIATDSQPVIDVKVARAGRWMVALTTPQFMMLQLQLDQHDYTNARARAMELVNSGIITQDDYNIFHDILPLVKV